jgi:predicted nucleic acid-binding protein
VFVGDGIRKSHRIRVEEPAAKVRDRAWDLFAKQLDKDYDLIDCVSFAMMEGFRIHEVFGFDRHFAQYGFSLLPGSQRD